MNEKKSGFLKHFLVIGTGTLINLLIGLISTPLITRLVNPVEYGQLSIFTMYANIAEMVLCLGLDQALVRYYYESDDIVHKRALLFKCIKLPVIVTAICAALFIVLTSTGVIKFEFDTYISVWLCLCVLFQLIYRFSLLIVRLEYKSKLYSILNILRKLAYLVLVVLFVLVFRKDYLNLLVISTVLSILICLLLSIYIQKDMWNFRINKSETCTTNNTELMKYAAPFIISMGVTQIFQAIDKISLNTYRSYAEVGVYSSTMTLVNIFAIIQTTFNSLWGPMQVEHYSRDSEDRTFYQKGNQIITVIMFLIGLSLILAKDLFAILLGSKYREAAYILPFLIFNPIMYTISETTVGGLVFKKKSNMQVVVALGACITNIIGNTILVPKLGCQGAAISTGISYIVFFSLRTFLSSKYYYTDFGLKRFYLLTLFACLYAFYNTFFKFCVWSVVGYLICVFMLYLLYRPTIHWGILYLKENGIKELRKIKRK